MEKLLVSVDTGSSRLESLPSHSEKPRRAQLADDPYLDEPKLVLAGDALNTNEREEMNKLLDKWNNVLKDTSGHTNIFIT